MLLQDVYVLNNLKILNEGKGNTRMKISGTFQRADEANNNKRIYPKKVLEGAVKTLQTPIGERMLVGELDHPEYDVVKLSNASHLITNLRMQGGEVIGEAEILSTPAGQAVRNLINDGVKVGISSRGMGSLQDNPDGTRTVNEDYKCLTFDIVADPSTRGAFPGLTESTKIRDIVETTINEASKEKIFVQILKNKLEEGRRPDPNDPLTRELHRGTSEDPEVRHAEAQRGGARGKKTKGLFTAMGIGDEPKVPKTPESLKKRRQAKEEEEAQEATAPVNEISQELIKKVAKSRVKHHKGEKEKAESRQKLAQAKAGEGPAYRHWVSKTGHATSSEEPEGSRPHKRAVRTARKAGKTAEKHREMISKKRDQGARMLAKHGAGIKSGVAHRQRPDNPSAVAARKKIAAAAGRETYGPFAVKKGVDEAFGQEPSKYGTPKKTKMGRRQFTGDTDPGGLGQHMATPQDRYQAASKKARGKARSFTDPSHRRARGVKKVRSANEASINYKELFGPAIKNIIEGDAPWLSAKAMDWERNPPRTTAEKARYSRHKKEAAQKKAAPKPQTEATTSEKDIKARKTIRRVISTPKPHRRDYPTPAFDPYERHEEFKADTKKWEKGKGVAKRAAKRRGMEIGEATVKAVVKNITTNHKKPTDVPKGYEKKAGRPKFKLGSQI